MVSNHHWRSRFVIAVSFLIALVLQIIPWPGVVELLRPSWLLLVTIYWVLALPHRINVGTALCLGLLWDLLVGSTLGIRGMMMAIVIYLAALNFLVLRNMALWQQALLVGLLSILAEALIFFGEYLIQDVSFNSMVLWVGLINSILWPWMFLLMRKIRRQWRVR